MRYLFYLLCCIGILGFALKEETPTKNYPQDYFRSPVDRPIGGYGNALYIVHPKGYMTVYAHLQNFSKEVATYVKQKQYEKKSYNLDLYLDATTFKVKKGEQIGKLGVSGRSFGPHLHFEIRDNRTQKPINPLLFGFKMEDHIAPKMHQLKVYHLNDKKETLDTKIYKLQKSGNNYRVKGDTLTIGAWRAGFALKVYDHHDGVSNWNGIYALQMYQDGALVNGFHMNTFAFKESRYINCHLDYEEQVANKAYFNRTYPLPGNKLSVYDKKEGIILLHKNKSSHIKMIAKDADGNKSVFEFWVKRGEVDAPPTRNYNYDFPYGQTNSIALNSFKANFPSGTFYENIYVKYETSPDESADVYSDIHRLGKKTIPVHKYYDISIKPTTFPTALKNKAVLAYCEGDKMISQGGKWKGDFLTARVRSLGDYCITVDHTPPSIEPQQFSSNMVGTSKMTFKITDTMPTGGKAKGLRFKGYIDGRWVLMEYDEKKDLLTHRFDSRTIKGEHVFKLVVKDDRGNEAVFQELFRR